MISADLLIDYRGPLYDIVAQGKVDIGDFRATIEFPAPYAIYAFDAHGRNIRQSIIWRNLPVIRADFEKVYKETLSIRQSLIYTRARLLERIQEFDLRAPAPPPPARNPFKDRLRRITGRLSDTARRPRLGATPQAIPGTGERIGRTDKEGRRRIKHRFYSARRARRHGPRSYR